jgi:PAS domain S-box-containing protein
MDNNTDLNGRLWDLAPISIDLLAPSGEILRVNHHQAGKLGYQPAELEGGAWKSIYTRPSRETISQLFSENATESEPLVLQLRTRGRSLIEMAAHFSFVDDPTNGRCLMIAKVEAAPVDHQVAQLSQDLDILEGIILSSRNPSWCIEYPEPVDLSAPDNEIIRQFFENRRHWRHCNTAMEKMYRLPMGEDLSQHSVDEIFGRNPDNEEFVRELIKNDFNLDGVASYDQRYDGTAFYVENDVHSEVKNGYLLRMWGTVRDLSRQHRREQELLYRKNQVEAILNGIVDPVLVLSEDGLITGLNAAVSQTFGWPSERLLGERIYQLSEEKDVSDYLLGELLAGRPVSHMMFEIKCRDGSALMTETSAGSYTSNLGKEHVLVLRLAQKPQLAAQRAS